MSNELENVAMRQTVGKVERIIQMVPAWDKTPKAPGEPNYGIHGMEHFWTVRRGLYAVSWKLMLPWYLPQNRKSFGLHNSWDFDGLGDIQTHGPNALNWCDYDNGDCPYIGQKCYGQSNAIASNTIFDVLVEHGAEEVWKRLEQMLDALQLETEEHSRASNCP